jgi:hypothetical protein
VELLPHILDVLFAYFKNETALEEAWRDVNASYVLYETIANLDTQRKSNCKNSIFLGKSKILESMVDLLSDEEKNDLLHEKTTSKMLKYLLGRVEDTDFATQVSKLLKDKVTLAQEKGTSFLIAKLLELPSTSASVKKELMPHLSKLSACEDAGCKQVVALLSPK